ncbi:MAG: carbamoyltransferase C-terminal domain-containing protein [Acidobacteriota bacterium]|nr:carbamoyltransferase C-terminal domain-containing protein [Acidobacteriota bacterium]
MNILGFTGGFDRVHETHYGFPIDFAHDAAAVLVQDGVIAAAIEEERLNRIKHTNKAPANAVRFCLEQAGIGLEDVDHFGYYATEPFLDEFFLRYHLDHPHLGTFKGTRAILQDAFERDFGHRPDADRFHFISHHMAHAVSAFAVCGHEDSLVLSMDGVGESVSTMVLDGRGKSLNVLAAKPQHYSLGNYYTRAIGFLGYRIYDEYKVMGLAPYGDPSRFREVFNEFYALLPGGDYVIYNERVLNLHRTLPPRRRGEPFTQLHKDIAAALQESLEAIVFHILRHQQDVTGHENLALAGGVAQNSSMIGKLWKSGLFRDIFVQPAADDAGCAIGCALAVAHQVTPALPKTRLAHTFWGTDAGSAESIEATLSGWSAFLDFKRMADPFAETAALLADGAVAGWVQGRTEFGPRALGNRSIIADPRLAAHKDTINAMIKKREGYRPFAPSVLEERAGDFFEVPPDQGRFPFMSSVLQVREEWRESLGAITHVDGSARLQTVSRDTNPRYYALIEAFGKQTGVPMVLNTSFNNNVEPIVNTAEEAIVCFLTSGLNYLVIGDYLAWKRPELGPALLAGCRLWLSPCSQLTATDVVDEHGARQTRFALVRNYDSTRSLTISESAYRVIKAADAGTSLDDVLRQCGTSAADAALMTELFGVWSDRYVLVSPGGPAA